MNLDWLERTELLIKEDGIKKLQKSNVLVVGMGGVGSYAAEFLVRAGIGSITIIDGDVVDNTNRNRQLHAMKSTIGLSKVDLMSDRLLDINPELILLAIKEFIQPERADEIVDVKYNYVIEAIDSFTPKLRVINAAYTKQIPLISSMGAGGNLDPSKVQIKDISKTYNCPLARFTRKHLRNDFNIKKGINVVFSNEVQHKESLKYTDGQNFKSFYGTISFIPALFGLYAASKVINDIISTD